MSIPRPSDASAPRIAPRARRHTVAATALALVALLAAAGDLAAQTVEPRGQWFPDRRAFPPLLADPREVQLATGLAWTNLFRPDAGAAERPQFAFDDPEDMRRDLHGTVALGTTLPLWGTEPWPEGGIVVAAQAGVFARFRVEEPSRDYAASDWMVALPIEIERNPFAARLRIVHRSSHLGDEVIEDIGVRRIEFGHEALELLLARRLGNGRVYGGGAWIFRSNTEHERLLAGRGIRDDAALQLGIDGTWVSWADGRLGLLAGVDWQSAQRTGWRDQFSAIAGIAARGPAGGLRLVLRYFDGPSSVGEFFLTHESFWSIELVAER